MGEPFESTYASSLVFALGYIARDEDLELNAAWATSLAQSPADASVGDMILAWTGRKFIFEFKRNEGTLKSELKKPMKRRLLNAFQSPKGASWRAIAERGHFLAYGVSHGVGGLRFFPYPFVGDARIPNDSLWDTNSFVKSVLFNEAYGFSGAHFGTYLKILDHTGSNGAHDHSRVSGTSTLDALVVSYDRKARQLSFVQLDLLDRGIRIDRASSIARGLSGHEREPDLGRG